MASSALSLASVASMLAMLPGALAGFNPGSGSNVAVYWGQNSFNQGSGPNAQQRLSYYCSSKRPSNGNSDISN